MTHNAFDFVREHHVASLKLTLQEYHHKATGAVHYHMACKDTNNAFLVAFRTVPQDDTGVAHILEHTALCGSRRFPVRDPFFMMIRRSLNTFMNAFTSADWTAYPFASQNRKDFNNLLQVYLDAAFFPNLELLDFLQEGHRVEFEVPDDPNTPLVFKGVVYNEMKGAMSAPTRRVWQTLQSHLFPTTTYHYNSGGDPEHIPDLTWEQLRAFHATHYHPSNAVFMTYGSFPVDEHQAMFEDLALARFERQALDFSIPDERRYSAPLALEAPYPLDGEQDTAEKTHIVLGWLLGHSTDLAEQMNAKLLTDVLLDNSASPLRNALETSELGTAPSELCGLDDDLREMVFAAGLEGSEPENAEAVEKLIHDVLSEVADKGVPREHVEAMLHQLELQQREVGGGRFPYGLQLMLRVLSPGLQGGDPMAMLDLDPVIERMRSDIRDDRFIRRLVQEQLLDNPHRVRLTMYPDTEMSARLAARERARLERIRAGMSKEDERRVIELTLELKKRQETPDDPEVLPKVGREDIPSDIPIPEGQPVELAPYLGGAWYGQPTNGLVYTQLVVDLPPLEGEALDRLPILCDCLTEVGTGERDYRETQAWQAAVSGGVSARSSVRADLTDLSRTPGHFVLASKALVRNVRPAGELLRETFQAARFDELERIRELVAQMRTYREAQVTGHGHVLAMTAASAGISPVGWLAQRWSGLEGLRILKSLDERLDDPQELRRFAEQLATLRDQVLDAPRQALLVGEEERRQELEQALREVWRPLAAEAGPRDFGIRAHLGPVRQGWATSTQVNFCAKAYPTVPQGHPDAPALMVLGPLLRNGYLHRAIREQGGAYGAGAGYNGDVGAFRFFSYRDPRLIGTLEDFDRSLDWLAEEATERELEEAVLNVISDIDRPDSPAGEAIGTFFANLYGRTPEWRRAFRRRVLAVTLDDLRRVADTYLDPAKAHVAVVASPQTLQAHQDALKLEIISV